MATRRSHPPEFKQEAVRLAQARGFSQAARDLDVDVSLIRKWKNRLDEGAERPFPGHGNPRDEELARLQRELKRLEEENAILKEAVGIFSKSPR
jgi:transposase